MVDEREKPGQGEHETPRQGPTGRSSEEPKAGLRGADQSDNPEGADDGDEETAQEAHPDDSPRNRPARFWQDILVGRERQPKVGELLVDEIEQRWKRASVRLKSLVSGRVDLKLGDRVQTFVWKSEPTAAPGGAGEDVGVPVPQQGAADCRIELSEQTLLRIAAGELNPQVAMLSDKVRIKGASGLAVYFFNLIAPRT